MRAFVIHVARDRHLTRRSPLQLLPPIIFYQGLSVQKNRLFKSTAVIAFFGIGGTLVSFALLSLVASLLGF